MVESKTKIELQDLIANVIDKVTENFDVDEIILFGSYAKGTAHGFSDVDIAIVSPNLNPRRSVCFNNLLVSDKANLYEPGLQLVSFASSVYYDENFVNADFIKEIKETGKQVFSKDNGLNLNII